MTEKRQSNTRVPVLRPASGLRGWPADEAGGRLVASAAQGVHSRRGCGKYRLNFLYTERNHQGKDNVLLFTTVSQDIERTDPMQGRDRLGELLKYYAREAV